MKATDIKIGQDYAVQRHGSENSRWPTPAERATVLGVEKHSRRVVTDARWDFSGHDSKSLMAQVEYREGIQKGIEWVVLSKVIRPWAEQAVRNDVEAAQKAEAALQTAAAARAANALAEALEAYDVANVYVGVHQPRHWDATVRVDLTPEQAEAVAAQLLGLR